MDAYQFTINKRGGTASNYRLLDEKVKLATRINLPYVVPDGDGWETVAASSIIVEATEEQLNRSKVQLRGSRKQRAARAVVPRESIKIIPIVKPACVEVAEARMVGGDEQVAQLEHEIRKLMDVVKHRAEAKARYDASVLLLQEKFGRK
jgi:hypothetical protein